MKTNFKRNLFVLVLIGFTIFLTSISVVKAQLVEKGGNPVVDKGGNPVKNNNGSSNTNNPSSTQGTANAKIENPLKNKNINSVDGFIKVILEGVIKISIPIVALAIIYSGFLFVSARGNTEKLGKAKQALLYTCIGAAILLGSWAIAQVISNTVLAL